MGIGSHELKRKLFHNLSLIYVAIYAFVPRAWALFILSLVLVVFAAVEFLRLRRPEINAWLLKRFGGIHREAEVTRPSGVAWTLLGCWLTMLVFDSKKIVLPALGFLAFGDTAAALGGKKFGTTHWPHNSNKTYVGSLCFFLVSVAWAKLFVRWPVAILSAAVGAWVEASPWPRVDDNLKVPFLGGLALSIFNLAIGRHR
jgi:dolichol kinase